MEKELMFYFKFIIKDSIGSTFKNLSYKKKKRGIKQKYIYNHHKVGHNDVYT